MLNSAPLGISYYRYLNHDHQIEFRHFVNHATHLALASGLEDLQVNMKYLYKVGRKVARGH